MKTQFKQVDLSEWLDSDEMIKAFLNAALEEDDPKHFVRALGLVAKAHGMSQVAKDSGLGRQNLYQALSGNNTPRMDTIQKVVGALGLHLHIVGSPKH